MTSDSDEALFASYLSRLGTQPDDDAFHSLLELDASWLPRLNQRRFPSGIQLNFTCVYQVIWRSRQDSVIEFLGTLLMDSNDEVWKEALNGLVALGNPAAAYEIDKAIRKFTDAGDKERVEWLRETQEQIERHDAR